ncbi:MAG: hypothetical protein AAF361_12505, partial [Bacteroidota bacterium]
RNYKKHVLSLVIKTGNEQIINDDGPDCVIQKQCDLVFFYTRFVLVKRIKMKSTTCNNTWKKTSFQVESIFLIPEIISQNYPFYPIDLIKSPDRQYSWGKRQRTGTLVVYNNSSVVRGK